MVLIETTNTPSALIVPNNVTPSNGVFESVFSAYKKLTKNPVAMIIFIFAILSIIAESNNQNGPFEIILQTLKNYVADDDHPAFIRSIFSFLIGIIGFFLKFKVVFFNLLLVSVIPMVYPDKNTSLVILFLILYVISSSHSSFILMLIIQLVFVYYSLDSFIDKLIILFLFVYLVFGTENLNLIFTLKT